VLHDIKWPADSRQHIVKLINSLLLVSCTLCQLLSLLIDECIVILLQLVISNLSNSRYDQSFRYVISSRIDTSIAEDHVF